MFFYFMKIEQAFNNFTERISKFSYDLELNNKIKKQIQISIKSKKLERLLNDPALSKEKRDSYRQKIEEIYLESLREFRKHNVGSIVSQEEIEKDELRKLKYFGHRLKTRTRGKFLRFYKKEVKQKKISKILYFNIKRNIPIKHKSKIF